MTNRWIFSGALALTLFLVSGLARADIAPLTHFVQNGEFAVGVSPSLSFSDPAGFGADFRFTAGLTDLNDLTGIVGTSGGASGFHAGAAFTFDVFPDLESQPGIGIATQAVYYRVSGSASVTGSTSQIGQLDVTAIPYIHKTFKSSTSEYEPFLAVPLGYAFSNGTYAGISDITVGSLFKASDHFRYSLEFGIGVNHEDSYIAGGITYYH